VHRLVPDVTATRSRVYINGGLERAPWRSLNIYILSFTEDAYHIRLSTLHPQHYIYIYPGVLPPP
jgi:hypothetical protein